MKVNIGKYPERHSDERKIKIQIDPWDVWSMDHTLALIITPMLKLLKEKQKGAPSVDDSDVPDNIKASAAPAPLENYVDVFWFDRWNYVLDEMIASFELISSGELYEKLDTAKEDKRIENGLRLFGKYYRSLWD